MLYTLGGRAQQQCMWLLSHSNQTKRGKNNNKATAILAEAASLRMKDNGAHMLGRLLVVTLEICVSDTLTS